MRNGFISTARFLLAGWITLGLGLLAPGPAAADPDGCTDWVAILVSAEGRVETRPDGRPVWRAVALNDRYCAGDELRTLENSRAALQLRNDTIVRLDQRAMVKFVPVEPEVPLLLRLLSGKAFFMSRHPRPLTIETPFMNAASGGTEYLIEVDEETGTATLIVIEGVMHLSNPAGRLTVGAGESSITRAGEAPAPHLAVRPRDVLQWALYYPPVLSLRDLQLDPEAAAADWQAAVRASIAAYEAGDVAGAFDALAGAPDGSNDPRFHAYRASLLLSVGRVDEARGDIARSLALAPGNGLARALEALIAVVLNEPEQALQHALDAAATEPDSASVKIALSYAWQANLNLPEALGAAQAATRLDPDSALAWARTAELWMSQGYLGEALDAAAKAEVLNPREARYRTVLGFAYLTQIRVREAAAVFERAIEINSADPMPRLGLGLAKIRRGRLAEGRTDIEIAAALDPANALIRSYLGKAYFEEKRDPQAAAQFDLAKVLDPNDPTAYLYDAIRKQTVNRPVEAMRDLQESVRLNDNRAVYRSRLLLDNDLSTRSVSQGRIAEDLGFGQLALAEGWKSVNSDPSNYSAHRFLADSYSALPKSEVAQQSALGLSQLLQPLNNNPVQPSLGDRTAFAPGTSPGDLSFNEYTQLFNRNQMRVLASGIVGNWGTWGEEIVVNGLYDRYSLSVGQLRSETDGYRENADISETIYNIFTQIALTPKASLLAEYRYDLTKTGDIAMQFDPEFFNPDLRRETETKTYRLGYRQMLTPRSDIILSSYYQDGRESLDMPPVAELDGVTDGYTGEAQYLFRGTSMNLIIGAGRFRAEDTSKGMIFGESVDDKVDTSHTNFYAYSYLHLPFNARMTIGGSGDWYEGRAIDDDLEQFNPKFGLIWDLTASTTLRLAALRVLERNYISNQTIEPSQVAGFQQFYRDADATDSKIYGIAVDQEFSPDLFGGLEFARRDLTIPIEAITPGAPTELEIEERTGRAYLYWMPLPWLSTTGEYYYERQDDSPFIQGTRVTTQRAPFGVNFHFPNGFYARLKATYYDQDGVFLDTSTFGLESGSDQFWLADAAVGYRLPKRRGVISVESRNIFDKEFQFQDDVLRYPSIQPERSVFARLTLVFD